jgi:hypothetical protein
MDLLTHDLTSIHPSYQAGEKPPSLVSRIFWPTFTRPPKNYWKLWYHFLEKIVKPYHQTTSLSWIKNRSP